MRPRDLRLRFALQATTAIVRQESQNVNRCWAIPSMLGSRESSIGLASASPQSVLSTAGITDSREESEEGIDSSGGRMLGM